jgi:hypothetical protein
MDAPSLFCTLYQVSVLTQAKFPINVSGSRDRPRAMPGLSMGTGLLLPGRSDQNPRIPVLSVVGAGNHVHIHAGTVEPVGQQ